VRARWTGRTRGFTVTGGAPSLSIDLRKDWSRRIALLIPKLIVKVGVAEIRKAGVCSPVNW